MKRHKVSTATAVISGLVGSQSLRKKLEGDNSPVPTRSKSLRMRGSSSDSHGVAKGNKGNRRSFAVMHSSLDSSIWFLLWFKFEIGNTHSWNIFFLQFLPAQWRINLFQSIPDNQNCEIGWRRTSETTTFVASSTPRPSLLMGWEMTHGYSIVIALSKAHDRL